MEEKTDFTGPLQRVRPFQTLNARCMNNTPAYTALTASFTRLHHLSHLGAIAGWDQAAMMPPKGNEARAAALAELQVLLHQTLTDVALPGHLQAAAAEPLDARQQANLREMRRDWEITNLLPERLVQAQSLAGSRCEHAWRSQRKANDWADFLATVAGIAQQVIGRQTWQAAQHLPPAWLPGAGSFGHQKFSWWWPGSGKSDGF